MSEIKEQYSNGIKPSDAIIALIVIVFLALSVIFYSPVLTNENGLKALIEAEATILGFFGLMVVYMLSSLDTRIDRLEQQRFDISAKHADEASKLGEVKNKVRGLKKDIVRRSQIIGVMLVVSLLICIGLLGIQNLYLSALESEPSGVFVMIVSGIGALAIFLFFESVWFLFTLFKSIQVWS
jgi:hypothetical protein